MSYSSHIPEPLRRSPRGGGIFNLIALIATVILTGGIGLGILALIDASSCVVNIFWGCSGGTSGTNINGSTLCASAPNSCGQSNVGTLQSTTACPSGSTSIDPNSQQDTCSTPIFSGGGKGGGGGGGGCVCYSLDSSGNYIQTSSGGFCGGKGGSPCGPTYQTVPTITINSCSAPTPSNASCPSTCTSAPNACGMTNTGNISGGGCSATTPSNASCPAPSLNNPGFSAQPSTLHGGGTQGISPPPNNGTTLFWDATNVTSCTITGDNGFSFTTTQPKGSVSTGTLWNTTTFTLTCEDGPGGPTVTRSLKVLVDPHYKEV